MRINAVAFMQGYLAQYCGGIRPVRPPSNR
jgi:hypothetical protein